MFGGARWGAIERNRHDGECNTITFIWGMQCYSVYKGNALFLVYKGTAIL